PLSSSEIDVLGGDVLGQPEMRRGGGGFVLTRLHARYAKDSLGEDLVFRAAAPITGGREARGANGALEHGATPSSVNNFQGRYAIRHPWTGAVSCDHPRRGVWGGPPSAGGGPIAPGPVAARNLAFVTRSAALPTLLRSDVPELGITGVARPLGQ